MLSAGNLVVNEGNTMLGSKEVEMLSVLRILNRPFMEYARSHCAETAKQQFNKTVVDDPATLPPPAAPRMPQALRAVPRTRSRQASGRKHTVFYNCLCLCLFVFVCGGVALGVVFANTAVCKHVCVCVSGVEI